MRRALRDNSLSLAFLGLFLAALVGQSIAGHRVYNEDAAMHGSETISYVRYLVSSHFGQAVLENWQSEYLQFSLFILATIWLFQRGSNESKQAKDLGLESDERQKLGAHAGPGAPRWARYPGGFKRWLYSNSLLLAMAVIFFGSWLGQSVTGWSEFNQEQQDHQEQAVTWAGYVTGPDFWENTLQNWQSEFLAVGSMAVFTIYLRQRGSPESKPVGSRHDETGAEG
jgi:uncharacterized protein DUF6766